MSTYKVLLIDNNPLTRETLKEFLLLKGFYVKVASDGAEGIKIAGINYPDLVLINLKAPEFDGYVFTTWLSKTPDPPPVIVFIDRVEEVKPDPIITGTILKPVALNHLEIMIYLALNKNPFQPYSRDTLWS